MTHGHGVARRRRLTMARRGAHGGDPAAAEGSTAHRRERRRPGVERMACGSPVCRPRIRTEVFMRAVPRGSVGCKRGMSPAAVGSRVCWVACAGRWKPGCAGLGLRKGERRGVASSSTGPRKGGSLGSGLPRLRVLVVCSHGVELDWP